MNGTEDKQAAPPMDARSSGIYPFYDAHWHLRKMEIVQADKEGKLAGSHAWAKAEAAMGQAKDEDRVRVVLIDNSVDFRHPNLVPAIDTGRMIDFLSHRLGVFPESADGPPGGFDTSGIAALKMGPETQKLCAELLARLTKPGSKVATEAQSFEPATSPNFSAHGTGMAGLIGARPVVGEMAFQREYEGEDTTIGAALTKPRTTLPYAGVDPYCRIVPVSTSFDEDPEQLIMALLYAEIVQADVIVLARDFPDPRVFGTAEAKLEGFQPLADLKEAEPQGFVPPADRKEDETLWDELRELIKEISRRRPILCAAGNGADKSAIYPASLESEENGIIPIGAVTSDGYRAGYSPDTDQVSIYAPSGDGERFDEEALALDTRAQSFEQEVHSPEMVAKGGPIDTAAFSYRDLITTDVSGMYGYVRGAFRAPASSVADFGAYYTRFSGTSGAAAVAAGFLSLLMSAGLVARPKSVGDGKAAKDYLAQLLKAKDPDGSGREQMPFLVWPNSP